LAANFPGYLDRLVFVTGSGVRTADGLECRTATCTLATADGQTHRQSGDRRAVVYASREDGTAFAALANNRWNPNFGNFTAGVTDLDSRYHAFQSGINRRMSRNLAAQLSYTYSKCTDISSGNWGQEGGTMILNPYNVEDDRGPCTFQLTHNLSANAVYALPFTGKPADRRLAGQRNPLCQLRRSVHDRLRARSPPHAILLAGRSAHA